jgi:hypothetical protein
MRAELHEIDGSLQQLVWAAGGVRLIGVLRDRSHPAMAYRASLGLLSVLGGGLLVTSSSRLMGRYPLIGLVLLVLIALGLLVAMPGCGVLARVVGNRVIALPGRRLRSVMAATAVVSFLSVLLGLGWGAERTTDQVLTNGPVSAGVTAGFAGHGAVEAELDRRPGLSRSDTYLTTGVKPLAINGVPMTQLADQSGFAVNGEPPPGARAVLHDELLDQLKLLATHLSSIQGFDLVHGQRPDSIGFDGDYGAIGPGPNEIDGPWGRMLDARDAGSVNVLVPLIEVQPCSGPTHGPLAAAAMCIDYRVHNGATISVPSLATGQILNLRIIGQYTPEDGTVTPLFGRVLADEGLVRTLSGNHPSYVYGIRLDTPERGELLDRLHVIAPDARLYDFSSQAGAPSYTGFTDLNTLELNWMFDHGRQLLLMAVASTLLAAAMIVTGRGALAVPRRG